MNCTFCRRQISVTLIIFILKKKITYSWLNFLNVLFNLKKVINCMRLHIDFSIHLSRKKTLFFLRVLLNKILTFHIYNNGSYVSKVIFLFTLPVWLEKCTNYRRKVYYLKVYLDFIKYIVLKLFLQPPFLLILYDSNHVLLCTPFITL